MIYWKFDLTKGFNQFKLNKSQVYPKGSFILYKNLNEGNISFNSLITGNSDLIVNPSTVSNHIELNRIELDKNVSFCIRPLINIYLVSQNILINTFYEFVGYYMINITFASINLNSKYSSILYLVKERKI